MYVCKHHQLNEPEAILALIESAGASPRMGWWRTISRFSWTAPQVPMSTLMGHVARANSVWRQLLADTASVVMFQGAQSYITPGWYPGKAEHGKVVPTWNYTVAHVHGIARAIEDPKWMLDMLNRLTDAQESRQTRPWHVSDAPPDFVEKLMRGIVGIEIPIDRLEAKLKASQDEDLQDRRGTVTGLQSVPGDQTRAMADLVLAAISTEAP